MHASIAVLGIGGAGGRVVSAARPALDEAANVVAINTDVQELETVTVPVKIQIGAARTGGLGTGGNTGTGRLAADDDLPTLREILADRQLVLVVAGLGGGTGSGVVPAVVRAARDAGALTLAFVSMPFGFEGRKRAAAAADALRAIREVADTTVVTASDRLFESVGETEVKTAFDRSAAMLGRCLGALCNLITRPGYINLDFADLRDVVRNSGGTCTLGYARADGPDRVSRVTAELLEGTLLQQGKCVREAASMLVGIVGGPALAVREVGALMDAVHTAATEACHVRMGTTIDDSMGDTLEVLALVSEVWSGEADQRETAVKRPQRRGGRRASSGGKQRHTQVLLSLHTAGRGRFKNVEATVVDGEDLDIPTYMRRGINLESS